jgi:hypothetical protein
MWHRPHLAQMCAKGIHPPRGHSLTHTHSHTRGSLWAARPVMQSYNRRQRRRQTSFSPIVKWFLIAMLVWPVAFNLHLLLTDEHTSSVPASLVVLYIGQIFPVHFPDRLDCFRAISEAVSYGNRQAAIDCTTPTVTYSVAYHLDPIHYTRTDISTSSPPISLPVIALFPFSINNSNIFSIRHFSSHLTPVGLIPLAGLIKATTHRRPQIGIDRSHQPIPTSILKPILA